MLRVTRQLDLSAFGGRYRGDGQGGTPYSPAVLVPLLYYCVLRKKRSVREIAGACVDDLGARVITGGLRPHYSTVSRFIIRHKDDLKGVLVQAVGLCADEGLIGGEAVVAIDGSPVPGNAAKSSNVTADKLEAMIAAAEAEVEAMADAILEDLLRSARPQDSLAGWDDEQYPPAGPRPDRKLAARIARLGRLRYAKKVLEQRAAAPDSGHSKAAAAGEKARRAEQKLAEMEAAAQARAEAYQRAEAARIAAGQPRRRGNTPVPPEKSKTIARQRDQAARLRARARKSREEAAAEPAVVSVTDPDSRLIPAKSGGVMQGWNLEISAVTRQVLIWAGLHDSPNDKQALVPAVEGTLANWQAASVTAIIAAWLADSGYASKDNFTALQHLDGLYVAVRKEAAQTGRDPAASDGDGDIPAAWQDMAARTGTPEGKALYRKRGATVEPAFAQMFRTLGRYISRRGRDLAETETALLASAFDIGKIITSRQRQAAARRRRPAAAPA